MIKEIRIIKPYLRRPLNERTLDGSLYKEGLSRAPKTTLSVTMLTDANGKPITGIDENAMRIKSIRDENARNLEYARIKSLREELEMLTGEDLSTSSTFWKEKLSTPYSLIDGDNIFDLSDPFKAIDFYWLTELPIIASSLDDILTGKYNRSRVEFYIHDPEIESKNEFNRKKLINDTVATLNKMGATELSRVAFLLNLKLPESAEMTFVYNELDNYIKAPKKFGSHDPIAEFNKVAAYTPQTMAIKVLVKKLIEERVIKQRGDSVLDGENIIAKSIEDLEIKLAEDSDFYIDMETKYKSKRSFVDNI
jgi:hypothetical protein